MQASIVERSLRIVKKSLRGYKALRQGKQLDLKKDCQLIQKYMNDKPLFVTEAGRVWRRRDVTFKTASEYLESRYPRHSRRKQVWLNTAHTIDGSSGIFDSCFKFDLHQKVMVKKPRYKTDNNNSDGWLDS